jgi:hypothetical protein
VKKTAMMSIAKRSSTGERHEERAQRGRQRCADHRQNGERERDVGRGRYRPSRERSAAYRVDHAVHQCRHGHPAQRRHHRQRRGGSWPQLAGDQLPLQFDPGDEEEDREQPVS